MQRGNPSSFIKLYNIQYLKNEDTVRLLVQSVRENVDSNLSILFSDLTQLFGKLFSLYYCV